MKYKLPIPFLDRELFRIISKEVRRQKIYVVHPSRNKLKEIAIVARAIKQRGLPKNLIRKKLPGGIGYGIFLHPEAEPILKGQIIAPYAGEVSFVPQYLPEDFLYAFETLSDIILTKEEQVRFDGSRRYHPRRLYALHVNALKEGNFTRFINHSDKPNLVSDFFKIPSNSFGLAPSPLEIIYLAKKTIRPGQQLLINYDGEDQSYWNALEIKPVPITPTTFKLDSSLKVIGFL